MIETTTTWFPIFTLIIGFALSWITELLKDLRTSSREAKAREAIRQDKLNSFQHQTLLELQETLMDLTRKTSQIHFQDMLAYKKTGKWQKQMFEEGLSEGFRLAVARFTLLSVRVHDDSIRELAENVKIFATKVTLCASQDDSLSAYNNMSDSFEKLNTRIGELLRTLNALA
jgi:hypothetical protein